MESCGTLALCETDEISTRLNMVELESLAEAPLVPVDSEEAFVSGSNCYNSSSRRSWEAIDNGVTCIAQLQELFPDIDEDLLSQALLRSGDSVERAAIAILEMSHQPSSRASSLPDGGEYQDGEWIEMISNASNSSFHVQGNREYRDGEWVEALRRDGQWCKAYIEEFLNWSGRSSIASFRAYRVTWEDGHETDRVKTDWEIRKWYQDMPADNIAEVPLACKLAFLVACVPCAPCIAGALGVTCQYLDYHPCTPTIYDNWEVEIDHRLHPTNISPRSQLSLRSWLSSPRLCSTRSTVSPRSSDYADTFASARSSDTMQLPLIDNIAETREETGDLSDGNRAHRCNSCWQPVKGEDDSLLCSNCAAATHGGYRVTLPKNRPAYTLTWDNELLWNTESADSVSTVHHMEMEPNRSKYNPPAPLDEDACFRTLSGGQYRTGVGRDSSPSRPGFRAGGGTSGPWWTGTDEQYLGR